MKLRINFWFQTTRKESFKFIYLILHFLAYLSLSLNFMLDSFDLLTLTSIYALSWMAYTHRKFRFYLRSVGPDNFFWNRAFEVGSECARREDTLTNVFGVVNYTLKIGLLAQVHSPRWSPNLVFGVR